MSADVSTKGFMTKTLFNRLRLLTNIYTREEVTSLAINPPPMDNAGKEIDIEWSCGCNTQYHIIMNGASAKNQKARKPAKVKGKAKAKSKAKPQPIAVCHSLVVACVGIPEPTTPWFLRVDYGATNYVKSTDDSRCPLWEDVKVRRTYNLRNGALIRHDTIIHVQGDKVNAFLWGIGNAGANVATRQCSNHCELIDGGLSRDIITFLYVKLLITEEDVTLEKRALSYVTPLFRFTYLQTI